MSERLDHSNFLIHTQFFHWLCNPVQYQAPGTPAAPGYRRPLIGSRDDPGSPPRLVMSPVIYSGHQSRVHFTLSLSNRPVITPQRRPGATGNRIHQPGCDKTVLNINSAPMTDTTCSELGSVEMRTSNRSLRRGDESPATVIEVVADVNPLLLFSLKIDTRKLMAEQYMMSDFGSELEIAQICGDENVCIFHRGLRRGDESPAIVTEVVAHLKPLLLFSLNIDKQSRNEQIHARQGDAPVGGLAVGGEGQAVSCLRTKPDMVLSYCHLLLFVTIQTQGWHVTLTSQPQ
ncbi:hypothetical protein J6590_011285 [Homalodisca vitripennis]|nr:hypothetical protein J6590_011285 [Homalodisca vitripennis]